MDGLEIIKQYLIDNDFDGLVNCDAPCGCSIENLRVCDTDPSECQPAYEKKADCKACDSKNYCDVSGIDNAKCYTTDITKRKIHQERPGEIPV